MVQAWQPAKHGGSVLRVIVGHHFTGWLVVRDHTWWRGCNAHFELLAVDLDLVAELHPLTDVGGHVVDRHMALGDQFFHLDARSQTRLRQHLVQLGRLGLWQQHAFAQALVFAGGLDVKLARHDVGELDHRLVGQGGPVVVVFRMHGVLLRHLRQD